MKLKLASLLLATVWARFTSAEVIVDQEYFLAPQSSSFGYFLDYPGDYFQQTFTVNNSGELAGVGVQVSLYANTLGEYPAPIDDLHLQIVRTDPDGFGLLDQVLAEATVLPSSLPFTYNAKPGAMTDVDLSSWHLPVTAGEKLSIVLSSDQTDHSGTITNYLWFYNVYVPHPGGEFSIYSPQLYGPTPLRDIWLPDEDKTVDAGFRVYVDVIPEPHSLALLAVAMILTPELRRIRSSEREKAKRKALAWGN